MSEQENIDTSANSRSSDKSRHLGKLYQDWFLEYASYVILDRAIPGIEDGLKPVQRRILHALNDLEDGRFNKAANVIGHAMRYHPHGDMAISDAMVKLAQKDLLIETQGNWGNSLTGDRAAASRYIEARLSPFAKEVVFNAETTVWQQSYDGRNQEPLNLPIKFPLLLAQGVDGIAVGLSTKIMPHNFCELIQQSIAILKGFKPNIVPDFPGGGSADFSDYKDGQKGGKVKVRAVIEVVNQKTLCIREIPYGVTTISLIESIVSAIEKNQIKVKSVQDNTAQHVEIMINLVAGSSPEKIIQALFAFTDCEISISPNCCIISNGKPVFCGVSDVLKTVTENTQALLQLELEIAQAKFKQKIHAAILEQIFIEEKIYRKIENCTSWDEVIKKIRTQMKPFAERILLELTDSDLERLTEIKIKRITKFDIDASRSSLDKIKQELESVEKELANVKRYTIAYYRNILKKYGKDRERQTKIESFYKVDVAAVTLNDQKLYVNRKEGFVGTSLKQDEFVCDCSKIDEIIAICEDGTFKVSKVDAKTYYGKNIVWLGIFKKGDERRVYHLIYRDGKAGPAMAKRFNILTATKDKTYNLIKSPIGSKALYVSVNPNGESEKVRIVLKTSPNLRKKEHDFDFSSLEIKTRTVQGTKLTKHQVSKISLIKKGTSTLAAQRLWFDRTLGKLSFDGNGIYLGKMESEDKLIALFQSGIYEVLTCDGERQFSDELIDIQKLKHDTVISTIYVDGDRDEIYVKRVAVKDEKVGCRNFIPQSTGSKVMLATLKASPVIKAEFDTKKNKKAPASQIIRLLDFIDLKSMKALGNKLSDFPIKQVKMVRE